MGILKGKEDEIEIFITNSKASNDESAYSKDWFQVLSINLAKSVQIASNDSDEQHFLKELWEKQHPEEFKQKFKATFEKF